MGWTVKFTPQAEKELNKLSPAVAKEIIAYLRQKVLAQEHPTRLGKPLRYDMSGLWRYRVGKYRILCQIREEILVVVVVSIGKRDKVYE